MNTSKSPILLILGHGSSKHPGSSQSVRMHAELLGQRGNFREVRCAFLKEEPLIEHVMDGLDEEPVVIVPDFLAEGYFTRQVIPKLLGLEGRSENVRYCNPVGTHPRMQELMLQSAQEQLGQWQASEVSVLFVGHGSTKNSQSKNTLLNHIRAIVDQSLFAQVGDLWLEEPPFVPDWREVTRNNRVIVVPFLLSDGQHGGWDIPQDLGIEGDEVHGVTHQLGDYQIRIAPALGTTAAFADVIEQMTQSG